MSDLVRVLETLREFYVAFHKPEWAEGRTADDVAVDVRLLLDEYALDGFDAARVPPSGDDDGGPSPLICKERP